MLALLVLFGYENYAHVDLSWMQYIFIMIISITIYIIFEILNLMFNIFAVFREIISILFYPFKRLINILKRGKNKKDNEQ